MKKKLVDEHFFFFPQAENLSGRQPREAKNQLCLALGLELWKDWHRKALESLKFAFPDFADTLK